MSWKQGTRSLSAKLSVLTTAIVTLTVAAVTILSANKFRAYILQTIEETSTEMADRTAADIAAILEAWVGQIAVTTSKLQGLNVDPNKNDTDLAAALNAEKDFLALSLFRLDGQKIEIVRQAQASPDLGTEQSTGQKQLSPEFVKALIAHLADEIATNPNLFYNGRFARNVTHLTKIPTALIAVKFAIANDATKNAVIILLASTTKLQVALPQSRFTSAYIVSGDGTMFGSTDETEMGSPSPIKGNALVQKALLRRSPSGFIPEFTDRNRRQKIGSFAQVPGAVPLYVIVERDRNAAFQVITKMYFTATLWGAMIILIAILVSVISANSITKHLVSLVEITKRIAAGDFTSRAQGDSTDEVGELRKSVNHMAERIGGLMVSEVEKARFEKELETARMVQSTFFPKTNVNTSYLSVTGSYQPATECGGDLWGHYTVRKNVELVFIADAMGHGAPAALVTAIAYAVCQSIAGILKDNENVDNTPGKLLKRLNDIIMEAVDGKISMTFFAALFDFNTGKIVYANAGHNYPFVLTSNKSDPRLGKTTKKSQPDIQSWPITLTLQGNPLGVSREMEYNEKSIDMVAGDKIFFYTDGLIENHFDENKPLGRKGLVEAVSKMGSSSIDQIKTGIQQTGCDIYGDKNLQDDVTIVVAEISPSWVKQELSSSTPSAESTPLVIDLDFAGLTNEPKNASGI